MDLRRVLIVAITLLLATPLYGQDRVFDTEVTADTNLLKYLPGGSQEVFMRKRGPFRLGWNWNGPDVKAIDTLLGIRLNHLHLYGSTIPSGVYLIQVTTPSGVVITNQVSIVH